MRIKYSNQPKTTQGIALGGWWKFYLRLYETWIPIPTPECLQTPYCSPVWRHLTKHQTATLSYPAPPQAQTQCGYQRACLEFSPQFACALYCKKGYTALLKSLRFELQLLFKKLTLWVHDKKNCSKTVKIDFLMTFSCLFISQTAKTWKY